MTTEHAIHPYCDLFPDIAQNELQKLADDIEANGQHQPIYRWNNQIIDGKNRFRACQLAGVTPLFEAWHPTNPQDAEKTDAEIWRFARSMNLHRRQLTESQYSVIAAMKSNMKRGDNQHTNEDTPAGVSSQSEAAAEMGVSLRSVSRAAKVIEQGSQPLVEAVRNGDVSVSDAEKVVKLPKAEQNKAVKAVESGKSPTVAKAAGIDPEADRKAAIMGAQKTTMFDPVELEAKAKSLVVDTAKPLAEQISHQVKMLESFCRSLVKFFDDNLPSDPWLDEGQVEIARSQLKSCCGAIRVAKAHDKPCPKCGGKGCKTCRNCGYLPKMTYEMNGGV